MSNYYNENDPKAAAWLRELIKAGHIPAGDVDERSIEDVKAEDVRGYTQCHFFAGIGGWPLALRIAGVSADFPLWTGSCPCQPISCAGKRQGAMDERHLWPVWYSLIAECRPDTIYGEQTASGDGPEWLDGVSLDMEELGYAIGTGDLPAACVGAPGIRQRLWWVGHSDSPRPQSGRQAATDAGHRSPVVADGGARGLADALPTGRSEGRPGTRRRPATGRGSVGGLGYAEGDNKRRNPVSRAHGEGKPPRRPSGPRRLGDADSRQCPKRQEPSAWEERQALAGASPSIESPWSRYDLVGCADGKSRRVEPGIFPLAHGVPGRVGLLRGYGNAINPWVAAKFIRAHIEKRSQSSPETKG